MRPFILEYVYCRLADPTVRYLALALLISSLGVLWILSGDIGATEVIVEPYESLSYDGEIQAYHYDVNSNTADCDCVRNERYDSWDSFSLEQTSVYDRFYIESED